MPNLVSINQAILVDIGMSLLVPIEPNEKVALFLMENNSIKLKFAKSNG